APRGAVSQTTVDRSADAVAGHLEDAAHFPGGRADGIARPRTEADSRFCERMASIALKASVSRATPLCCCSSNSNSVNHVRQRPPTTRLLARVSPNRT